MTTGILMREEAKKNATRSPKNLICFSHLRWDFVFQRPQQLLSRMTDIFNIYFIEEPIYNVEQSTNITYNRNDTTVVVPHIAKNVTDVISIQRQLLDNLIADANITDFALWYYTPMALCFSSHLRSDVIIYDCMDELSAFDFAPTELKHLERILLQKADIVFTGGHALYDAKKSQHSNIHPFPSSVDKKHFGRARHITAAPGDQSNIAAPRMGFFGVIDERFDIDLIEKVALQKPEWHIILVGPVVKIDPAKLPRYDNIHYLDSKLYDELPEYISGWDIALIPFQLNASTEFISPTKTPEYLAAGVPVISTPIRDVIDPYGVNGLVQIVSSVDEFIQAAESILYQRSADTIWLKKVDDFLSNESWELTVERMTAKIEEVIERKIANA